MDITNYFVGGLILAAFAVSEGIKKKKPSDESKRFGVLREIITNREIIREPISSSRAKTVMCPFCNKILQ